MLLRRAYSLGLRLAPALAGLCGLYLLTPVAHGAELSLVSGLYKNESRTVDSKDAGKKMTIDGTGRFAEQIDGHLFWFGQGGLMLRSYSKGDLGEAPGNSTSLKAGGGVRYYFNKLSENISPYALALAEFRDDKNADFEGAGYKETEDNGLYYSGAFGIRINLQKEFFVDLEETLFDSPLFATTTETTATPDATGGMTKSKTVTSKNELYAKTFGDLKTFQIALGMRL